MTVRPAMLVVTGVVVFMVLLFQFLQGKRVIKFKGALHRKVHAKVAWALVSVALAHAVLGIVWSLSLR